MNPLPWPDNHHLDAAGGWLELGLPVEAAAEIQRIAPELRLHPEVLNVRWQILAREKNWDTCLVIAGALTRLMPEIRGGLDSSFLHVARTRPDAGSVGQSGWSRQPFSRRLHHHL